jgi:hypothetical protein
MIGKLLKWFTKLLDDAKPMRQQPKEFQDPTYPPDLAELFDENRTENHTDKCMWQRYDRE